MKKISPTRIVEYERAREAERDERRYKTFVKEHQGAIICSMFCIPFSICFSKRVEQDD